MSDAEEKISMTPQELAALVDARISERELRREVEQATRAPRPPDPDIYRTPAANPEFEAELIAALAAENDDPAKAAVRVLRLVSSTPPAQPLAQLFKEWRHPEFGPYTGPLLKTYIENLKAKRERDARRQREQAGV